MMRTFVIGDIHGAYQALLQCFERSGFNRERDHLMVLGDVCDGFPEVRECIEELRKLPHGDLITGNHDLWVMDWAEKGLKPVIWLNQGGRGTLRSYADGVFPPEHLAFLKTGKFWIEREGQLFIHGGLNPEVPLSKQEADDFVWDRGLLEKAWKYQMNGKAQPLGPYKDIFLGHTPTQIYHSSTPLHFCNVWALDTGAGWSGKLTIMDAETKDYWQSDPVSELYAGVTSRSCFDWIT